MKFSDSIKEIAEALAKAQGMIEGAKRDSVNPFYKSNYADLDSVREAMRKPFADNGLSLTQNAHSLRSDNGEERLYLSAMLMHSSGQWIQYDPIYCGVKDQSPQSAKSSITLMRRTQLLSVCNMSEADDDGNSASINKPAPTVTRGVPSPYPVKEQSIKDLPNYADRPYSKAIAEKKGSQQ